MTTEILLALASFSVVTSITPGPNNMMLLASGATFGLRRTVPHILGIAGGCGAMVLVLGFGIAGLVNQVPGFHPALKAVSSAYLLWLAWRIATSDRPDAGQARGQPLGVLGAAAFQWVNPKAWAMVLGAVSAFARPDRLEADVPVIALVLMTAGLPCITLWAGAGSLLGRLLQNPVALRAFNVSAAALLALSILPGIWPGSD